jgi:hypothetical protein
MESEVTQAANCLVVRKLGLRGILPVDFLRRYEVSSLQGDHFSPEIRSVPDDMHRIRFYSNIDPGNTEDDQD